MGTKVYWGLGVLVKVLRLQSEERGHWSAKWIPPFLPDDTEALKLLKLPKPCISG